MWSKLVLCSLVGFVFASSNPAWKDQTEYVYEVRGRTLASLDDISTQHSGILLKAKLTIQPRSNGHLTARISRAKYAQIHTELPEGWNTYIPDTQVNYKDLPLTSDVFQIVMEHGIVKDLIVNKEVSTWETNILKSIVSQLQLDVKGKNAIPSQDNAIPQGKHLTGAFKTMEETTSGQSETAYDIHVLPRYIVESKPWMVSQKQLVGDEEIFEIVKSKNFSNSKYLSSYNFGFSGSEQLRVDSNQIGTFFTRSSKSRVVVTGNADRYTIHNSYTVNKIVVSPSMTEDQKESVVSMVNLTLTQVHASTQQPQEVTNPVRLGSLIYKQTKQQEKIAHPRLYRRSLENREDKLEEPSRPFFDQSIKYDSNVNIEESVKNLAREIEHIVKDSNSIMDKMVLDKFQILVDQIRTLSAEQLQRVSQELGTSETVFVNAVSVAGTGPSLLTIDMLIKSKKITPAQAAEAIFTLTNNVREPTPKFMIKLLKLVESMEIQKHEELTQTAILSLSDLIHREYVHNNRQMSLKETEFVKETVIPYFTQKLRQAVSARDTMNTNLYIQALGKIGHHDVLYSFEPFLEGRDQISNFQRLNMLLALRRLAEEQPKVARPVFNKIYQNPGESEDMRVASVYLLMYTKPSCEMLQRMAENTNEEQNENLNAAVKSTIEMATKLEGSHHRQLRECALTARPLLTKKTYGLHQAQNFLTTSVLGGLNKDEILLVENMQNIPSQGSYWNKYIRYSLNADSTGIRQPLLDAKFLVSNVEDLINGLQQHTRQYRQYQGSNQQIWSNLNIQGPQREQLEGLISLQLGKFCQFFAINNQTMDKLPQIVQRWEQDLKNGKHIDHLTFLNLPEVELAFPTEMGLPVVYSYTRPVFVKVKGHLKAHAQPQVSQDNQFQQPETVSVDGQIHLIVYGKTQGKIAFTTPFDHQEFSAGYDKKLFVQVPVKVKSHMNLKTMQIETEYEVLNEQQEKLRLFHYSSQPFTSQADLLSAEPITTRPNTHIIRQKSQQTIDQIVGKQETGIAFHVQYKFEEQRNKLWRLLKAIERRNVMDIMMQLTSNDAIENSELNVYLEPKESTTHKVVVRLGYKQEQQINTEGDYEGAESNDLRQVASLPSTPEGRQQSLMKKTAAGIHNANVKAVDVEVDFQGQQPIKYIWTSSVAYSKVDPKSRVLFRLKKDSQQTPFEFVFIAKSHGKNTNELSLTDAMNEEPTLKIHLKAGFAKNTEEMNPQLDTEIELRRSEGRKQFLQEEQVYQQCMNEMKQGNYYQEGCAEMHRRANLLDDVKVKVNHQHVPKHWKADIESTYRMLRLASGFVTPIETKYNKQQNNDEVDVHVRYSPDLKSADVTLRAGDEETRIKNFDIDDLLRSVDEDVSVLERETTKPTCVVDQTLVSTYSKRQYSINPLKNQWTVAMQYVPHGIFQREHQTEQYAVFVRRNEHQQTRKDVKIIVQEPRTNGKTITILMKPHQSQSHKAQVFVDEQEIQVRDSQVYTTSNDLVQIWRLNNGEVKVEIQDNFDVVYDGEHIKFNVLNGKFRGQIVGLCGQFNEQPSTDFRTPNNCIVSDVREFIESWNVEQRQPQSTHQCIQQKIVYTDAIPNKYETSEDEQTQSNSWNKQYRTRYVEQQDEICFTIEPVPVCSNGKSAQTETREIPVHCVKSTSASRMWKQQIDKGASPDFGHKPQSRTYRMEIPTTCVY